MKLLLFFLIAQFRIVLPLVNNAMLRQQILLMTVQSVEFTLFILLQQNNR